MKSWMVLNGVLMKNYHSKYLKAGNGYVLALYSSIIQVKHLIHQIEQGKN